MVWLAMHELRPEPEDRHVGRQDVPYRRQLISPGFDLRRPKWILRPRNLDAGLNLPQGDRRTVKVGILLGFQPGKHGAVGPSTTKDRKSTRLNSSHYRAPRMQSSA